MKCKYIYPHLPSIKTFPFIRYSGSGLCNSLFVYCRALLLSRDYSVRLINPTWLNFDPVQWKIWAKDKRTYMGIFNKVGMSGLRKVVFLMTHKKISEEEYLKCVNGRNNRGGDYIEVFYMKGFEPLQQDVPFVKAALTASIKKKWIAPIERYNFERKIAVHIRFGDYSEEHRQGISWYIRIIQQIHDRMPDYTFLLFTDAKDEEVSRIVELPYVKKTFFGSSISDLFAISSCSALVGSHSTFSDWGGISWTDTFDIAKTATIWEFLDSKRKRVYFG